MSLPFRRRRRRRGSCAGYRVTRDQVARRSGVLSGAGPELERDENSLVTHRLELSQKPPLRALSRQQTSEIGRFDVRWGQVSKCTTEQVPGGTVPGAALPTCTWT